MSRSLHQLRRAKSLLLEFQDTLRDSERLQDFRRRFFRRQRLMASVAILWNGVSGSIYVVAIVAVLTEGWQWQNSLAAIAPDIPGLVQALGHIPIFGRTPRGWSPLPETEAVARPTSLAPHP